MKRLVLMLVVLCASSGGALAGDPLGRMEFPAKNGNVMFLHESHVRQMQRDCKACHERPGEIKGFGREYAHRVCIGCHQPVGEQPIGPIACDGCHGNRP